VDRVLPTLVWLWAPLVAAGVSFIYWREARSSSGTQRVLISAHGYVMSILYILAVAVHMLGLSRPSLGVPFWGALLVPVAFMVVSLVRFEGAKSVHIWQIGNVLALGWTFFVGTMAVTGNWL
jgi:hypothetical protein